MPIPTPRSGEEKDKFISRCISRLHHIDKDRPDDQIIAMCYTQWRKHTGETPKGKLMQTLMKGKK